MHKVGIMFITLILYIKHDLLFISCVNAEFRLHIQNMSSL